jgi:hypothetical protein
MFVVSHKFLSDIIQYGGIWNLVKNRGRKVRLYENKRRIKYNIQLFNATSVGKKFLFVLDADYGYLGNRERERERELGRQI